MDNVVEAENLPSTNQIAEKARDHCDLNEIDDLRRRFENYY